GVEHTARNQCLNPSGEIVGGGNDTPGGRGIGMVHSSIVLRQEGASSCRSLNLGRARRFAHQRNRGAAVQVVVRGRVGNGVHCAAGELGVLHTQRLEQPVVHYLRQRLAVDFFSGETEQRIVGVVVLVLRARREIGWVRECNGQ